MAVRFTAPEYRADGSFGIAAYALEGSAGQGWTVWREGRRHVELGPGYRRLDTVSCGICATDLARRHLPFPLPQVIGHEVLALDEAGARHVVEINASCAARGLEPGCPFCRAGLSNHCPDRRVLGIHDLPGGFGPHVLAPVNAVLAVPDAIPDAAAVLVEPLAAALHAVMTVAPRAGDRVAVLGPRRLGLLGVAALRAYRRRHDLDVEIVALARREALLDRATEFGADTGYRVEGAGAELPDGFADVVIDTSGNPDALTLALRLARREVHVKSTHGRPSAGIDHLTELVVDELGIGGFRPADVAGRTVAWLAEDPPPAGLAVARMLRGEPAALLEALESGAAAAGGLARADVAVVDSAAGIDRAIRPRADREVSLVRPRGRILVRLRPGAAADSPLVRAVAERGLALTTSRCGDFRAALELMAADPELVRVSERLITHRFPPDRLQEAFAMAASPECIKAVVEQEARP
ncbi:MAG: alcohol dehydrogenase catalytic domain-containing protein [Planctomycetes bacterium]|nr:alcohol dehydrogenase catalytic domain-containing protein [Planctomycetota bacterium]